MLERVQGKGNPPTSLVGSKLVWPLWRTVRKSVKILELPQYPAIPRGIQTEKTVILKVACNSLFTEALFTTARTWKQPKCPTEEWIKKLWYIYPMEQYSALKKNELMPSAATWVDPEPTILAQRKTNIWHHLYVKPKKGYR